MTMKHEDVDYHQDELLRKRNQYENTAHNHHTTNSFLEHFQLPYSSCAILLKNNTYYRIPSIIIRTRLMFAFD